MNAQDITYWKEELERVLITLPNREPAVHIEDIRNLCAAMGDERVEALLNEYPYFFEYGPAIDPRFEVLGMGQGLPTALNRDVYLRRRPDAFPGAGRNSQSAK
jgi:hypothetical protein